MALIKLFPHLHSDQPLSLALGVFDGMHIGHQQLFTKLFENPYKKAILTFSNIIKTKHRYDCLLTSIADREEIARQLGIDTTFFIDFDEEVKNLSPKKFVDLFLVDLNIAEIIVGEDFRFGARAAGRAGDLSKFLPNAKTTIVPTMFSPEGKKISTTFIIEQLINGNLEKANSELTRLYRIKGSVQSGFHTGSRIGFPTANILPQTNYVIPQNGVYATYIEIESKRYLSMTNIGIHPTINQLSSPSIEVNVFDLNDDLYGKKISLEFIEKIREEKKFPSLRDLQVELKKNKEFIIKKYQ